ncbi:MAG TPA: TetR/AcrR family transcriptional regulator [Solirubrobacteraceae bacterium]|jgi:AcrR family transcriptional regulator
MASTPNQPATRGRRRRADADRSVASILDAAVDALASDPEASMAEIARRAGVVRATIYVHFPTREALIAAITHRAIAEATEALRAADPAHGEPADALARLLSASWQTLGRYHALVQINSRLGPEHMHAVHQPVLRLVRPLLKRGQASGAFNRDLPTDWMLTVLLELIHAASRDVTTGTLAADTAERALIATVTGAFCTPDQRGEMTTR